MTKTPNFQDILDDAPTEIVRPKPLPEGTYRWVVGAPRYDKSAKKSTPFVEFILKAISCEDDIDEEALEEAGGLDGKQMKATFYLTEDAVWRLDEFHEACGIDLEEEVSRRIRNDQVLNAQVLGRVRHRASEDGTQTFGELRSFAAAE